MKKKGIGVAVCFIVLLLIGGFIYINYSPPLVAGNGIGSTNDEKVKIVEMENRYRFGKIQVTDVFVNDGKQPLESKIQVSNHQKGFIITADFYGEEAERFTFKNLESIKTPPNTAPAKQLQKLNEGKVSGVDFIYAVHVSHDESVNQMTVQYEYLGMSYDMVISTN
ncbi:hypothetical protein SAMN04487936_103270 [Halobacillus dabanensis]|uniref:Uncharacterized protein n=1 Tax=Halobacillus dabanensis TaxID=240302 RepID=A0A1I3TBC7_HALDA|nr:hypothetical protein [Halobacillus dabanensis]SFJ67041.1 hypothetical protein SAMN04487936_103270 [Halobacillus dabanensis]